LSLAIPTILVSCFRPMLIRIGLIHPGKRWLLQVADQERIQETKLSNGF
jgi:hypothetical protein